MKLYRIMTVIDNRVMLRDIHYFLKDQKNYEIKYVLFSPRAFSTFVEYRPDIILVDAEAFVYYKKIIELFAQSLWDYRVILIVSHHDLEKQFRNVTLIHKNELNKLFLLTVLAGAVSEMQADRIPAPFSRRLPKEKLDSASSFDTYILIYAKYTHSYRAEYTQESLLSLQSLLETYGKTDMTATGTDDLFSLIQQSHAARKVAGLKIAEMIFGNMGYRYALFVMQDIPWRDAESAYYLMLGCNPLAYFFNREVVNVRSEKTEVHPITFEALDDALSRQSVALLNHNIADLKSLLREFYLHTIKESHNLQALDYFRWMLAEYAELFHAICKQTFKRELTPYATIEQEHTYMEAFYIELVRKLDKLSLPGVLSAALQYVFSHYNEDIALDETATVLGVNKNYLSHQFKHYLDATFLDVVQHLKLHKAYFLLAKTNQKVVTIAAAIGYRDAHYFSRLCKKQTGLSPEKLRGVGRMMFKED